MPPSKLRKPTARRCEVCDRREVWDEDVESWLVAETDGEKQVGNRYCIHEWDINGTFAPFED
jgi:hypothetical protein